MRLKFRSPKVVDLKVVHFLGHPVEPNLQLTDRVEHIVRRSCNLLGSSQFSSAHPDSFCYNPPQCPCSCQRSQPLGLFSNWIICRTLVWSAYIKFRSTTCSVLPGNNLSCSIVLMFHLQIINHDRPHVFKMLVSLLSLQVLHYSLSNRVGEIHTNLEIAYET